MEIGVFSKTYGGTVDDVFRAISAQGLRHTQYNLSSSGLPPLPEHINWERMRETAAAAEEYGVTMDALSGTFNMIAPEREERSEGVRRFRLLCEAAAYLRIPVVTLCTGSKNPKSKWEWHEDNLKPSSWRDLIETTEQVLLLAQEYNVTLGVETEVSNIVNTPARARMYLDTFSSPRLKIIMDGANLFLPSQIADMGQVLEDAFELLGEDVVLAHAKDLARTEGLEFVAAGEGVLDFPLYVTLLKKYGYTGALILHGLSESQVPSSVRFLGKVIEDA